MKDLNRIAQELFDKIHSRFGNTTIGDENAKSTDDPMLARFFNFDYTDTSGKNYGNVTASIVDTDSLKVYFGKNLSQEMDEPQKKEWYEFLKQLRFFAKRNMMKFDARDISRSGLTYKDIRQSSKVDRPYKTKELNLGESLMFGNDKTSYQTVGPIKLIIRHTKPVDMSRYGSRSRNIDSIFFQNLDGERFKSPYRNLMVSRALANHLSRGGKFNDEHYNNVCSMYEGMKKLGSFVRRSKFEGYQDPEIIRLVNEAKKEYISGSNILRRMATGKHYESALNEVKAILSQKATDEDMGYIKEKLTKHVIDNRIETALPDISRVFHKKKENDKTIMDSTKWLFDRQLIRDVAENLAMYDSAVKYNTMEQMVTHVLENLKQKLSEKNLSEYASKCQSWQENFDQMENLTEKNLVGKFVLEVVRQSKKLKPEVIAEYNNPIDIVNTLVEAEFDDEIDIKELQSIMNSKLEFGADGDNAVGIIEELFKNLDDVDNLKDLLYKESKENPNEDARSLIKYWLMDKHPEIYDQMDLSKVEKAEAENNLEKEEPIAPPPPAPPQPLPEPAMEPGSTPAMTGIEMAQTPPVLPGNQPIMPVEPIPPQQPMAPIQPIQELKKLSGIR